MAQIALWVTWTLFWVFWLVRARQAHASRHDVRPITRLSMVLWLILLATSARLVWRHHSHGPLEATLGLLLVWSGLAVALWARRHLGREWGRPMTQRVEPHLITSGPYRVVRHPIYSGLLLAVVGTAVAASWWWLISAVLLTYFFVLSSREEERFLEGEFPAEYPAYRARTRALIPFVW